MTQTRVISISKDERRALMESGYTQPIREHGSYRWWAVEPIQMHLSGNATVRVLVEITGKDALNAPS